VNRIRGPRPGGWNGQYEPGQLLLRLTDKKVGLIVREHLIFNAKVEYFTKNADKRNLRFYSLDKPRSLVAVQIPLAW
jgi:hypothetical protein